MVDEEKKKENSPEEHSKKEHSAEEHSEHHEHHEERKKSFNIAKIMKSNPWMFATVVLAVLSLVLLIVVVAGGSSISEKSAGTKAVGFLNNYVVSDGGVTLDSVNKSEGAYVVTVNYDGNKPSVYISLDGRYMDFGNGMVSVEAFVDAQENPTPTPQPTPTEVPKSAKPVVELFVMSYCPYGTQAEKGILPVVALLGDKIDFKLRAVHYVLHGEKETLENNRELCIREEQGQDILNKYLVCILDSDDPYSPKDPAACEKEAGVNSAKLKTCMANGKAEEYFAFDSQLSQAYGVQGSPTLIINGVKSNAGRSSQSYLEGICAAFSSSPAECSQTLSSASPSAGFGYNEGTDTVAQC